MHMQLGVTEADTLSWLGGVHAIRGCSIHLPPWCIESTKEYMIACLEGVLTFQLENNPIKHYTE